MLTLTTSQAHAAAKPATEPVGLLDFATMSGEAYHLATQVCTYEGIAYAARLENVSIAAGGVEFAYQLPGTKSLTARIANDDGFFSTKRPGWLRGQPLTYREVFLDVDSAAVRQYGFTITQPRCEMDGTFVLEAEDALAPIRQKLFPSTDVLITTSLYPNLNRGVFQAGADGLNRPIPFLFGRTFCPIYYVDQSSDGSHIYVACVGSAYLSSGSATVVDWWDGGFSVIGLDPNTDPRSAVGNDGHSTFPWSVRYAVRNFTREDQSTGSIPVTEIVVHPNISPGDPIGRRFADLTWDHGSSAWSTPDEVLVQMLRDCFAGVHISPTVLNSATLLTAHSFYAANSLYFDGAIIEQRPFEEWLAQWQHDALTRLNLRHDIRLIPCNSRTAVMSFGDTNIVNGAVAFTDVPLDREYSRRTLYYRDRTRDADYGPGDGQQGEARGGSKVTWNAGSGAEITMASPFIGRPSVGNQVVQYWAKAAFFGQRTNDWTMTTKGIAVEEGDVAVLTNSFTGVNSQLVEVLGVAHRDAGIYEIHVAETHPSVWSAAIGTDPDFRLLYQRVSYNAGSQGIYPFNLFTVSHQLGATPTRLLPWTGYPGIADYLLITSLTVTNDSQFMVGVALNATNLAGSVFANAQVIVKGWYIYV